MVAVFPDFTRVCQVEGEKEEGRWTPWGAPAARLLSPALEQGEEGRGPNLEGRGGRGGRDAGPCPGVSMASQHRSLQVKHCRGLSPSSPYHCPSAHCAHHTDEDTETQEMQKGFPRVAQISLTPRRHCSLQQSQGWLTRGRRGAELALTGSASPSFSLWTATEPSQHHQVLGLVY